MMRALEQRGGLRTEPYRTRIVSGRAQLQAALAVFACFVGATAALAYRLNVWQDEAYSLHTSSLGALEALRQGVTFEAQAPLYFGILAVWQTLNGSLFFARLLSIAAICVALYFVWCFACRYIAGVAPAAVLAAVAFNPFTIWAAVEVRPYAVAIALSSMLIYAYFRGWIDDEPSYGARAAFVVVAILGAYTQYYIATLVPAAVAGVCYLRRPKRMLSILLAAGIVAAALAPIALILPLQLTSYKALNAVSGLPAYSILLAVAEYLYPHGWIGTWVHAPLKNAAYFVLAAVPFGLAWRFRSALSTTAAVLVVLVSVIAACFAAFIGLAHVPVLFPRHTAVLTVPVILAAFAIFATVTQARRSAVLTAFTIVYASFAALSLWSSYHHLAKNGDWRRVATFLSANAKASDAVAIFDAEAELPLRSYFQALPVQAIPRPLSFERFDEADFVLHRPQDVAASLGRVAKGHARTWLILNDVCMTRPAFYGCGVLDRYVAENFRIVRVVKFDGSSVSELIASRAH